MDVREKYYLKLLEDYPDMVGMNEFCKMVGFSKQKGYQVLDNYGIEYFSFKRFILENF